MPRFLSVTFQHPSPYYDDSYAVNSENNGPYGDAILQELIAAVETKFRVIREPWARKLSGGSTGGWEALALQIFHPDFFGGAWASCPDSVDFRYHQIVNIYNDANAYFVDKGWTKVERPNTRTPDGNITSMMKDENWFELVSGDKSRSGGQWDIWEAAYGPVGPDGYPKRIWDKKTGEIDKAVAAYWRDHYDLRAILEKNWTTLGPKLQGKLHIYVGDEDSFYLNDAVGLMEKFLESTRTPYYAGSVTYQRGAPHCWGPRDQGSVRPDDAGHRAQRPAGFGHHELALQVALPMAGRLLRSCRWHRSEIARSAAPLPRGRVGRFDPPACVEPSTPAFAETKGDAPPRPPGHVPRPNVPPGAASRTATPMYVNGVLA